MNYEQRLLVTRSGLPVPGSWLLVLLTLVLLPCGLTAAAWAEDGASATSDQATPAPAPATPAPAPTAVPDENQKEIERLKVEIADLEKRLKNVEDGTVGAPTPAMRKKFDWDPNHECAPLSASTPWDPTYGAVALGNNIFFTFHGEFRSRAIVEANTVNDYMNFAGQRIYAYDPRSLTNHNDYGWWDSRLQIKSTFNFGTRADFFIWIQFGDIHWGTQSPAVGGRGTQLWDQVYPYFRQLYVRLSMDPIPLYLVFGRVPTELGNRLIMGNEYDGAYAFGGPKWLQPGFGAVRIYEGEPYEYDERWNDDEDSFFAWINSQINDHQKLTAIGWMKALVVASPPAAIDSLSPMYKLPGFTQVNYAGQSGRIWDAGLNWIGDFGPVTVNAEYDQEWGVLPASQKGKEAGAPDMHFTGRAAFEKTDWHVDNLDRLALTAGYGSGDNPRNPGRYSGFWAPDNDFKIKDFYADETIDRGLFMVYDSISPGAGVPGRLFDGLGSGGIENTIFANLAADIRKQDNHHYYISWGYLRAAEPNPQTHSADIGWELDARVDYIFNKNVTFSIYGGHLFITGDYFRFHAHDAAAIFFEWKLLW